MNHRVSEAIKCSSRKRNVLRKAKGDPLPSFTKFKEAKKNSKSENSLRVGVITLRIKGINQVMVIIIVITDRS